MRIGTDVSIKECRDSGYTVMDFKVKGLYPDGRKNGIDINYPARFTVSMPLYARRGYIGEKIIYIDVLLSWADLWEVYTENKKSIDSMIGGKHENNNIGEYELLNLASDIDSYMGLNNL